MDNDALMLQNMGNAVTELQVKYRASVLTERMALKPMLDEMVNDYTKYQLKLLKEGVICNDADLQQMTEIKGEIDAAAEKEALIKAVAKTIAFLASRI